MLGHGAFGCVLLVQHRVSKRLMAMKVVSKKRLCRSQVPEQILNETHVLSLSASHPFIVQMLFACQDDGNIYVVMQFIGGGDLFNVLETRRTLSEHETRFYVAEIVLSLKHLHELGVVYRYHRHRHPHPHASTITYPITMDNRF